MTPERSTGTDALGDEGGAGSTPASGTEEMREFIDEHDHKLHRNLLVVEYFTLCMPLAEHTWHEPDDVRQARILRMDEIQQELQPATTN